MVRVLAIGEILTLMFRVVTLLVQGPEEV